MKRAEPGPWYESYFMAWMAAHPGKNTMHAGAFYKEAGWVTHTPTWDAEWFAQQGKAMPK